jgi:hypothetical protein
MPRLVQNWVASFRVLAGHAGRAAVADHHQRRQLARLAAS